MDPALLEKLKSLLGRVFGLVQDALDDGLARAVLLRSRERRLDPEELVASLLGAGPGEEAELGLLVHHLLLGHTRFYRHERVWEELGRRLPEAFPKGPISALVAGCSSGEEAWTVACLLAATYGLGRYNVTAFDISPVALDTARRAIYPADETERLPPEWRKSFLAEVGADTLSIVPALRERVTFQWGNLARRLPPGPFHLVMCRNVLTYIARPVALEILRGLFRCVVPGGCLVLAPQELPLAQEAAAGTGTCWRPSSSGLPVLRQDAAGELHPSGRPRNRHKGADQDCFAATTEPGSLAASVLAPSSAASGSCRGPAVSPETPGEGAALAKPSGGPIPRGSVNGPLPSLSEALPVQGSGLASVCRLCLGAEVVRPDLREWVEFEQNLLEILRVPPSQLILDIKAVKGVDFRVKGKVMRALGLLRSAGTEVRIEGDVSLLSR